MKTRRQIIDSVENWHQKAGCAKHRLLGWLGFSLSTYHDWCKRANQANQHNGKIPKTHWLLPWERAKNRDFALTKPEEGYRRLSYTMIDANVVAVSHSSVYRVLKGSGLLERWRGKKSLKGSGFQQPIKPHEHWHAEMAYLNICRTFYYLCSVIDGYSRFVVHWEIMSNLIATPLPLLRIRKLYLEPTYINPPLNTYEQS